jgi:hypothetical protein
MNHKIFGAFQTREEQVSAFMAGCGSKYGMACTCGPNCKCVNCSEHCKTNQSVAFNAATFNPAMESMMGGMNHSNMVDSMRDSLSHQYFVGMASVPEREHTVASRNPSIISFGGNMRRISITSETTFGRAMSGLSALSIDWENMEDFDVNVDHSAHINNGNNDQSSPVGMDSLNTSSHMPGRRRSSIRRTFPAQAVSSASEDNQQLQVSFKV